MITWNAQEGPYAHTASTKAIFDGIKHVLAKCSTEHIKILSISRLSEDCQEAVVTLELPGAVTMEINCNRSDESDFRYCNDVSSNVAEMVSLVSDFVTVNCLFHGLDKIAELFDGARQNARKVLAQWSEATDAHIQLIDMRLSMSAHWRHTVELITEAEFSYLDDCLLPSSEIIKSYHPDHIVKDLRSIHSQSKERTAALRYFQHAGAG